MDIQPRITHLTGAKASPNQFQWSGDYLRIQSGTIYDPDDDSFRGAIRVTSTVVYKTACEYKNDRVATKAVTQQFERALGRLLEQSE